jgi:hypothetical protein
MIRAFKKLSEGVRRALIAGTLIGPFIIAAPLWAGIGGKYLAFVIVFGIPLYWLSVFIGIWIYSGFKKGNL